MIRALRAFVLLILGQSLWSQTSTSSTGWYQYFGDHPVSEHWGIHAEGQWRREHVITAWEQLLLRTGVVYQLNKHASFTLGYTYLRTFVYGEIPRNPSREHRIYQEFKLRHGIGPVDWEHRFRYEQRFSRPDRGRDWEFGERARYRLQARIPVAARTMEKARFYLSFYDEVFANFGPHGGDQALDQNRVYGALGINLKGSNKLELGYLYRYLPQPDAPLQQEHALQVSLFSNSRLFGRRTR
jgi:hypothetical protein